MATDPKPKQDSTSPDKAQLDRFKQTARELGCDESGKAFEEAFSRVVPAKPKPKVAKT